MANICIICPPKDYTTISRSIDHFEDWAEYALEINSVSVYLEKMSRNKINVNIVNMNVCSVQHVKDIICSKSYDIICIYFIENSIGISYKLIMQLRRKIVDTLFVGIGMYATMEYKTLLSKHIVDICILGEIEVTLFELCCFYKNNIHYQAIDGLVFWENGCLKKTNRRKVITNLDELPLSKHLIWNHTAAVSASRGCYCQCTFCQKQCYYRSNSGAAFRMRSPEKIVKEIEFLANCHNIDGIIFCDNSFFCNTQWNQRFLINLQRAQLNLRYTCSMRANDVIKSKEQLQLFAELGLRHVEVGVESFLDSQLIRFQKNVSSWENIEALNILDQFSIEVSFKLLLFDPYISLEDIIHTIVVIKQHKWFRNYNNILVPISLSARVHPFAETEFTRKIINDGLYPYNNNYQFRDSRVKRLYDFLIVWNQNIQQVFELRGSVNTVLDPKLKFHLFDLYYRLFWLNLHAMEDMCMDILLEQTDMRMYHNKSNQKYDNEIGLLINQINQINLAFK